MSSNRSRISLAPLRSTAWGKATGWTHCKVPPLWETLADIERGDGTGGWLIRHRSTQIYALWTGAGSIETLPQRKVTVALEAMSAK